MNDAKLQAANDLMIEGNYDAARAILLTMTADPAAKAMLTKLDSIVAAKKSSALTDQSSSTNILGILLLIAGVLILFAFVAMPWITLIITQMTGLDLARNFEQLMSQMNFNAFQQIDTSIRTLWLVPAVGGLSIWAALLTLLRRRPLTFSDGLFLLIASVACFYPLYYLYSSLNNSLLGSYLIESGFWVAVGCNIFVFVVALVGLGSRRGAR